MRRGRKFSVSESCEYELFHGVLLVGLEALSLHLLDRVWQEEPCGRLLALGMVCPRTWQDLPNCCASLQDVAQPLNPTADPSSLS